MLVVEDAAPVLVEVDVVLVVVAPEHVAGEVAVVVGAVEADVADDVDL